jgi:hypothetical protein
VNARGERRVAPTVAAEAQRILDRAARRLLAARLDSDSIGAAAGADGRAFDHGADQCSPLVTREKVPVAGTNGDCGRGGGE